MPASWGAWRPTLVDIAQRQDATADWDAMNRGGRRLAGHLSVTCLALAVAGGVTAMLVPSLSLVVGMVTGLLAVASVLCARVWLHDSPLETPGPQPLTVEPFTADENRGLIQAQAPEPFRAVSACPGCGNLAAHAMRQSRESEPSWANVIRNCAVCQREWAQG
jgi:hypothetical protein